MTGPINAPTDYEAGEHHDWIRVGGKPRKVGPSGCKQTCNEAPSPDSGLHPSQSILFVTLDVGKDFIHSGNQYSSTSDCRFLGASRASLGPGPNNAVIPFLIGVAPPASSVSPHSIPSEQRLRMIRGLKCRLLRHNPGIVILRTFCLDQARVSMLGINS